jgi:hypothetical protein
MKVKHQGLCKDRSIEELGDEGESLMLLPENIFELCFKERDDNTIKR